MKPFFFVLCVLVYAFFSKNCWAVSDSQIVLSEFLPNPTGDDAVGEWIELNNTGSTALSLDGWVLSDTYGTIQNFNLSGKTIDAGGYLVLFRSETQITLNNDSEQIKLSSPTGLVTLSPVVSNPVEGKSYSLVNGNWIVTDPTAGEPNQIPPTPTPSPSVLPTPSSSSIPSPSPAVSPHPSSTPFISTAQPLQLTEVLACGGSTEWVEIYNPNEFQLFLDGWKIQDSTTQSKLLDGMSISARAYVTKEWSGYMLNNAGDEVRLFQGDELVDAFTYNGCTTGFSWAKNGDHWEQTSQVTKNAANVFSSNSGQKDNEPTETSAFSLEMASPSASPTLRPQSIPSFAVTTQQDYPYQLPSLRVGMILGETSVATISESFTPSKKSLPSPRTGKIILPFLLTGSMWFFTAACLLSSDGTMNYHVAYAS